MNILLDTNVLSELLRAQPARSVLAWFAAQRPESLHVSAITQAEMLLGARVLPKGKRRAALEQALKTMFEQDFRGRVLAFDASAATAYVDIVAGRRTAGRPISQLDAQIAAIAQRADMKLATRNTADFTDCGLTLLNPWVDAAI